ncbi:MAG: PfkB family carbohydrate kinase, partial [Pseudomonadota bacterium]|nr:PfkB family carbohydrate kinase [Pseudomonadota bacterium]
ALPGGKGANQALAAARNWAATEMVGTVGSDGQAPTALAQLRSDGVGLAAVAEVEGASGLAMIAVDAGGENQIIVVSGANASATAAQLPPMEPGDWLVTQNEVDWTQTAQAHRLAREQGAGVIHNTAPAHGLSAAELARIDVLVANEHELAQAAASAAETGAEAQARSLLASGVGAVVLTLGAKGSALYLGDEAVTAVPAAPARVRDTTGAGDAFVGALAAALAVGRSLPEAVASANHYAARVCEVLGAQTPLDQVSS